MDQRKVSKAAPHSSAQRCNDFCLSACMASENIEGYIIIYIIIRIYMC